MLHPFTDKPVCQKCGNADISWRYYPPVHKGIDFRYDSRGEVNEHEKREHIYLRCRRCSREWMMRCRPEAKVGSPEEAGQRTALPSPSRVC